MASRLSLFHRDRVLGAILLFIIWMAGLLWSGSCSDKKQQSCRSARRSDKASVQLDMPSETIVISTSGDLLMAAGENICRISKWCDLQARPWALSFDLSWIPEWDRRSRPYPLNTVYAAIPPNRVLYASHKEKNTFLVVWDLLQSKELWKWSFEKRWNFKDIKSSYNGRYVALYMLEDFHFVSYDQEEHRLGILDTDTEEIEWITSISAKDISLATLNSIAVSEDGKYIAAVSSHEGGFIHLTDVAQRKVLWQKVPQGSEVPIGQWTVNFNDVCFSPDSKYIYVAGNCGLFCFDRTTGRILSQWEVPSRCASVAVSPNGELVAGGMFANGFVYIWDSQTGELVRKIRTGQFTVYGLAFSPDSTLLATSGVKSTGVKIWEMPSPDSAPPEPNN